MVCAHGGDISAGLANTMPAYRAALAHPAVKCVEVDVSRTRDDALVALHQRQLLTISDGELERCARNAASCAPAPRRNPAKLTWLTAHNCATQRGRRTARPGERSAAAPLAGQRFLASDARHESFAAQLKWFGAQDEGMRVLTLQEALDALLGKGIETIILDIKDGPPFGADGFASMMLDAIAAAQCKECIVWAKEDVVVAEVISRGLGARAGFVLMNETAEARDRGMHRMGRIQARC